MMRRWIAMLSVLLISGMGLGMNAFQTLAQNPRSIVSVEDIRNSTIVGRLGIELGTVFTIEGTIAPDTSRAKLREGKLLLKIDTVNQQRLTNPVEFADEDIAHDWFRKPKEQPRDMIGRRLKLAVYETGRFEGLPKGDRYNPPIAWVGFHFRSQLVSVHDFAEDMIQK